MTKIKATLYGIPQQRYEPQKFFHTSVKKPKIEYKQLYCFDFESEEPFEQIKENKYKYLPYPKNRRQIEKTFDLKIPIFIRKLVWKLEDTTDGYVE
jgi:hypothetical protein